MTTLAWQRGAGSPSERALVLVHSWASDGRRDWQDSGWVAGLEAAGLSVYAPDLPGHGGSGDVVVPDGAEPAAWTAGVMMSDLDRLGVDEFVSGGYAEGCLVAGHLAVRAEKRATQMVLVGCDDRARMAHADEIAAALRDPQAPVWSPDAAERIAEAHGDQRHDGGTLARWAQDARWPAAPRLGALRTATLLAVGTHDDFRARAPRLAQLFHDARLVTVPGDHRSSLAAPELIAAVASFVREQATGDRPA